MDPRSRDSVSTVVFGEVALPQGELLVFAWIPFLVTSGIPGRGVCCRESEGGRRGVWCAGVSASCVERVVFVLDVV